jgi:DNA primase
MHYYPKTNTVHCFGCGQSGDVVDVIQQLNGVEFRDAVRFLINK